MARVRFEWTGFRAGPVSDRVLRYVGLYGYVGGRLCVCACIDKYGSGSAPAMDGDGVRGLQRGAIPEICVSGQRPRGSLLCMVMRMDHCVSTRVSVCVYVCVYVSKKKRPWFGSGHGGRGET